MQNSFVPAWIQNLSEVVLGTGLHASNWVLLPYAVQSMQESRKVCYSKLTILRVMLKTIDKVHLRVESCRESNEEWKNVMG